MRKNKQKDISRAILPSKARRYARDLGRQIARTNRRLERENLNLLSDESDWDDIGVSARFGKRESKLRTMSCDRVNERRAADKLGPIKRWTEHQQRSIKNDEQVYEKICQILKPNQNFIARHAALHIEGWLDLKKDQYKYKHRHQRGSPVILNHHQFLQILNELFEIAHANLNKICKNTELKIGRCKDNDICADYRSYTIYLYEVYNPINKVWDITTYEVYNNTSGHKRIRHEERRHLFHNWRCCPNKLIIQDRNDLQHIVKILIPWGILTEEQISNLNKNDALYQILSQAQKKNLISGRLAVVLNNFS